MSDHPITYVVEHMEDELYEWSLLEYQHVQNRVGPAQFIITGLPSSVHLPLKPEAPLARSTLMHRSVTELPWPKERICLLDSEAPLALCPQDASLFDYVLAGGILGDVDENDPDRTKELRIFDYPTRHLGRVQMTLDTALLTAYIILNEQKAFEKLLFVDRPCFPLGSPFEMLTMPFRYLNIKHDAASTTPNKSPTTSTTGNSTSQEQPLLPPGMFQLWLEQSF